MKIALAHPLRREILIAIRGVTLSPSQFAREHCESLGNVPYHFKVLHDLGMLELVASVSDDSPEEHIYHTKGPAVLVGMTLDLMRESG